MLTVSELFDPLIGQWIWQVQKGYGSFLTMEFGEPRLEVREPKTVNPSASQKVKKNFQKRRVTIVGYWHLWVQYATWKIKTTNFQATSNDTDTNLIDACLNELDGQILKDVVEDKNSAICTLHFDLGGELELSPSSEFLEEEQWSLHYPAQKIYAYKSDGALVQLE